MSKLILDAVSFVKMAAKKNQVLYLRNGYVETNYENATLRAPVDLDVEAAVNLAVFEKSLKQFGENFTITADDEKVTISDGVNNVIVDNCQEAFTSLSVLESQAIINDSLKDAFNVAAPFMKLASKLIPLEEGISIHNNFVEYTSKSHILRYWHGIHLPDGLRVPCDVATYVGKVKKNPLVGLGFSNEVITFHFENGSTISCRQAYVEQIPETNHLFAVDETYHKFELTKDFYKSVAFVGSLATNGVIKLKDGFAYANGDEDSTMKQVDIKTESVLVPVASLLACKSFGFKAAIRFPTNELSSHYLFRSNDNLAIVTFNGCKDQLNQEDNKDDASDDN